MKFGVYLPQYEIGESASDVRAFVQGVEALEFDHIVMSDRVTSIDTEARPDWMPMGRRPTFGKDHPSREVFVLCGFIAGCTERVGLTPSVVVLPQRQTVLVAKQVAEIDNLSGGRIRLGVSTGWNDVEYAALGMSFDNRGKFLEEQVRLMRALWTEEMVEFEGQWHQLHAIGLNPRPVQRPIPVWMGGAADIVLKRIARMGDGWLAGYSQPEDVLKEKIGKLFDYAREYGRDPNTIGIEHQLRVKDKTPDEIKHSLKVLKDIGLSHLVIRTDIAGLSGPQAHLDEIKRCKDLMSDVGLV